jgi:hypothetical protein
MLVKMPPEIRQAIEVGRRSKMRFRPLEYADPSDDPVFKNDWWFIPQDQDKSIVL